MIEQRGKNRRRIEMRKAHEINRAFHADQRRRGQIANHAVIFNRLIIHAVFSRFIKARPKSELILSMQMRRRFRQHDFESWTDDAANQMAAARRRIWFAHHRMSVNLRSGTVQGNVADERKHFHLFTENYFFIIFLFQIEKSQRDFLERADGRENSSRRACIQLPLF